MNSVTGFTRHTFTGKKKAIALGIALALSTGVTQAAQQNCYSSISNVGGGNFSMISPQGTGATAVNPNYDPNLTSGPNSDPYIRGGAGYVFGGTNDVRFTWDGSMFDSSTDYTGNTSVSNATITSTTTFFGALWTAHHIQIFGPGSYTFDTTAYNGGANTEAGMMTMTVGANQIGAHMLFDWSGNLGIDVVNVWNKNQVFSNCGATAPDPLNGINCLWTGVTNTVNNTPATVFTVTSTDNNGDGTKGIPMAVGGPFAGNNANFNLKGTLTPLPGDPCASVLPAQFTFVDVTAATPGLQYTSNTITVSGLGVGVSAPVSIAGGEYSKNSGAYTSANGTAVNTDTFSVRQTSSANSDGTTTNTSLSIGGTSDTYSVTVIDKKPNAFSFTAQNNVAVSTLVESDTFNVAGMDTGLTTPISISAGGEYSVSLNSGVTWSPYSSTVPATVSNNNWVKVHQTSSANPATTTIVTLTLGQVSDGTAVSGAFSIRTAGGFNVRGNNFTMLDKTGNVTGGTNDVAMDWDQQSNTSVSDPVTPATAHMHLASGTPFFGYNWTAHHIRVFGPGTYTIDTTCTTAQLEAGTAVCNNPFGPGQTEQFYTFTVGPNQLGAHMLFDWNTTKNIDVVDIWNQSATFGPSQMYTGASGCADKTQVWDLMSTDWDNDGQNGKGMIDGPFLGFKANFNLRTTTAALPCSAYTPTVNVADPSNSPGCSISTTPVNALERADWWLIGGFLAWLGGIRIRFNNRKTKS